MEFVEGKESKIRILNAEDVSAVEEAAAAIRRGGLVAFPTETVYGLGADALNALAVARIFEVKQRPRIDPVIVHLADPDSAREYGHLPSEAAALMRRFWPGPLTLVVRKTGLIPPIVTAGLDTVGIRMPAHPAALALIRAAGRPVAAPSANSFGYVSPTEVRHIPDRILNHVDAVLDGGRCVVGIESTVLSLTSSVPRILRAGGVSAEALKAVLGDLEWSTSAQNRPEAPGQLSRHYATRTPLEILSQDNPAAMPRPHERAGLLALTDPGESAGYTAVEVLSKTGDLREAAANLFGALFRLDSLNLDRIVAHPMPEAGLGAAIMDRLRRCAAK